ncbi:hypothetical protein II654_00985, partial [bacterium]|nr:hypothetical protein [bacterium]
DTSKPTDLDTSIPTNEDTSKPTDVDTSKPTDQDTSKSTDEDTSKPTDQDTSKPTDVDSSKQTDQDTSKLTDQDTSKPTDQDTSKPTDVDSSKLTDEDTSKPTDQDTSKTTDQDTSKPTNEDSSKPTDEDTSKQADGDTINSTGSTRRNRILSEKLNINPSKINRINNRLIRKRRRNKESYGSIFSLEGTCQIIEKLDNDQTINSDTIANLNNMNYNFELNLTKCEEKVDENKYKINISFRQLNKFNYNDSSKSIVFYFYGMSTESLNKGHQITMLVNLIKNGFTEENATNATCVLENDIEIKDVPIQANFRCSILNIEERATSFIFNSSDSISGIPTDKVLLNPVSTEKSISKGNIVDYSIPDNSKSAPSFNTTSIDSTECRINGKFSLKGKLLSDLVEDLTFELPIYYPKNLTASCSIGKKNKSEETEIKCELNGEINNEEMMIIQNTIFDSKNKELLIINKIESDGPITCINSKAISANEKLKTSILFRQVSNFNPSDNFVYFYLVCLTSEDLRNKIITLLVNIINSQNKKEKKEINCILISEVNVNNGYVPAKFNCTSEVESKPNDIEIISSNDISGITDKLQDYQKSPNQTDL